MSPPLPGCRRGDTRAMHIGKFAGREAVERIRTHAPPTKTDASSRLSVHYMTIDGVAQSG